jgi:MoxR-like ATPase
LSIGKGYREKILRVIEEVSRVYLGPQERIESVLITLFAGGHLLIEDLPGIGKTTLALALASALKLTFRRVQMTADLLPLDLIGVSIYSPSEGKFRFHPGPLFTQLLLVDELNRAMPKTQSALLEAMEEHTVTVEGESYPLPKPFFVLATQNPVEHAGTFPLPDSQLDRFLMRIELGYPEEEREIEILLGRYLGKRELSLTPILSPEEIVTIQEEVRKVVVDPEVARYVRMVATATRNHPEVLAGISPRGALAWIMAGRARAYLKGREYLLPDDLYELAPFVLAHRITIREKGSSLKESRFLQQEIVRSSLEKVPAPL